MSPTPREVEDELNILSGQLLEEVGAAHTYLLGAQHALEWMQGRFPDSPWAHFIAMQGISVARRAQ